MEASSWLHCPGLTVPPPPSPNDRLQPRSTQKRAKLEDNIIKHEDEVDELADVAGPVIGIVDDVVDGVILWLRRILNVPAF